MEDWQQWQIRADQVAAALGGDVSALEEQYFSDGADPIFRGFWPRFRDLKERVRIAPAIKLEDKLALERRLRDLGSRAYKAQEGAYGRSGERKAELLMSIQSLREQAEAGESPRQLRAVRRDLDGIRGEFDSGTPLVPSDRQNVWDAWRDTNQFVWQRLTGMWSGNEEYLRDILTTAQTQLEAGNTGAARQAVGRFFEGLRTHESRQNVMSEMKSDAERIRNEVEHAETRRSTVRVSTQAVSGTSPLNSWRSELERNKETAVRLGTEVASLERQLQESGSILDQAMIRGNLVDKRQKLSEVERTNRALEQRIEQSAESPLISAG